MFYGCSIVDRTDENIRVALIQQCLIRGGFSPVETMGLEPTTP
jgi:hypothetical protein